MQVFYSDTFTIPLPEGHRFPITKYRRLRERIEQSSCTESCSLQLAPPASLQELCLAHEQEYVERALEGRLEKLEVRRIGFPWSSALMERSRRSTGATLEACRQALQGNTYAVNLAGGTHHASASQGQGFCVFNDSAVASLTMLAEQRCQRVLIVDVDVHHGNGTASILQDVPEVLTFSIHGANNFPLHKPDSDIDIGLPDGTGDNDYLLALKEGLSLAFERAKPELVIVLAGADPYKGDRLGKLALSRQGLARRDEMVFDFADVVDAAVVVVMAGGYAPDVEDIVDIHFQTVREAFSRHQKRRSRHSFTSPSGKQAR